MQASLLSATFLSGSAASTTAEGLTGAGKTATPGNGQTTGLFDSLLPQQQNLTAGGADQAMHQAQTPAQQVAGQRNSASSDTNVQADGNSALFTTTPLETSAIAPTNTQVAVTAALPGENVQPKTASGPAPAIVDKAALAELMLTKSATPGDAQNPGGIEAPTPSSDIATPPAPAFSAPPVPVTATVTTPVIAVSPAIPSAPPVDAPTDAPTVATPTAAAGTATQALDTNAILQSTRAGGELAQVETARGDALTGRFNQRAEWLSSQITAGSQDGGALASALSADGQTPGNAATTAQTVVATATAAASSTVTATAPGIAANPAAALQPGKLPTMGLATGQADTLSSEPPAKMAVSEPLMKSVQTPVQTATPQRVAAGQDLPELANPVAGTATAAATAASNSGQPVVASTPPVQPGTVTAAPMPLEPLQMADNGQAEPVLDKPQPVTAGAKADMKPEFAATAAKSDAFTPPPSEPRPAGQPVPGASMTAPGQVQAPQTQPGMSADSTTPFVPAATPQQAGQPPASAPGAQLKQKISKTAAATSGAAANTAAKPTASSGASSAASATDAAVTATSTASAATKPAAPMPMPGDVLPPPTLPADGGSGLRADTDLTLNRMDARPTGLERSTTPDGARFTPQTATNLAAQIQRRFVNGARVFDIRLDPAELGRVDVRLELSPDQRVQAILTVERPETLAEMQRNARELERALAEAGLDVGDDGLEFQLGGDTHWEDAKDQLDEDMIPVFQESEYLELADAGDEPQTQREAYGFRLAGGRDRLDMRI